MDSFEVRVQFTERLKRLGASRDSVLKVAAFALEHIDKFEDLFNCILEQICQANLRSRLNLLYLLDALSHLSISQASSTLDQAPRFPKQDISGEDPQPISITNLQQGARSDSPSHVENPYCKLIENNMLSIIENVVPQGPNGAANLSGARKVLNAWRAKRTFPSELINNMEDMLKSRQTESTHEPVFSRNEVYRRIEEDRERHKRMKEENWLQPTDPLERKEYEELSRSLKQPSLPALYDTLDELHAHFLYDTTSLGKI